MILVTEKQLQRWRTFRQDYLADLNPHPKAKNNLPVSEHQREVDKKRDQIQKVLLDLLNKYCTCNINAE